MKLSSVVKFWALGLLILNVQFVSAGQVGPGMISLRESILENTASDEQVIKPQSIASPMERPAGAYQSAAWATVQPSLAILPDIEGRPGGIAVLINKEGHFLAHISSISYEPLTATLNNGKTVKLGRLAYDRETQLVLLGAYEWDEPNRRPIRVARDQKTGEVMVATVNGPVKGDITSQNRPGLFYPSQRYVPLSEIQMEARDYPVGGAVLFTNAGDLVGILGATLAVDRALPGQGTSRFQNVGGFGPQGLTIGYALGAKILSRVVDGFLEPDHVVDHPTIGIYFRAGTNPLEIIVDRLIPDGPADKAGLKAGDVILAANGTKVDNVLGFASYLFELTPGETLKLKIRRGPSEKEIEVKVAVQDPDL